MLNHFFLADVSAGQIFTGLGYTVLMTFIATIAAYLIGLPLGVLLHLTSKNGMLENKPVNLVLGIIVNILRSVPCLILVVICMPWTRAWFGRASGEWYTILIPLVMATFAFVARIVEQSLAEVPAGEVEAARSLGATNFQIIKNVLIPESRSGLITGFVVTLVNVIGYTSFAYNIGAGGLIADIWTFYSKNTADFMTQFTFWLMIIVVVVLVQVIQELGALIAKSVDHRRKFKK
ncbi:MAG: ABC transporter permease [Bacilli bacterium]|jgi:D-methionine transport system permease protein|nr:ABC transporter permease [Bacilli bacterium]